MACASNSAAASTSAASRRFNASAIKPERLQTIQQIFGLGKNQNEVDLFAAVNDFVQNLGLPTTLAEVDIALDAEDHQMLAEQTLRMVLIKNNPRPVSVEDGVELMKAMA